VATRETSAFSSFLHNQERHATIADGDEDGSVELLGEVKSCGSKGEPMDRIVCMLEEVRTLLIAQMVLSCYGEKREQIQELTSTPAKYKWACQPNLLSGGVEIVGAGQGDQHFLALSVGGGACYLGKILELL